MERLTKEIKARGRKTYRISPSLQHRGEVKLGQLEDILEKHDIDVEQLGNILTEYAEHKKIEKEFGIDLVTLFKALSKGFSYIMCGEIETALLSNWKLNVRKKRLDYKPWSFHIELKDYGKTWALTRKELE